MSCTFCNDAVLREDLHRVDVRQTGDIEATRDNCIYCRLIMRVFHDHGCQRDQRIHVCNDGNGHGATQGIKILVGLPDSQYGTHFDFVIRNLRGLDGPSFLKILHSGPVHTGSYLAQAWAARKIKNCSENHRACKSSPHALPDRVLFLGSRMGDDRTWLESGVKLYEANGEVEKYATLSHRWGAKKPLQLLSSNLEAFKSGIAWSSLPQTFKDAIHFARRLDILYLWIDSLCIIQDSRGDWERQSTKMASIYEHSIVTLAACVAEDSTVGCFVSPPPFLTGFVAGGDDSFMKAGAYDLPKVLEVLRAHQNTGVAYLKGLTVPDDMKGTGLLFTRGWVYQERLLSPRILHFGHVQLSLECSTHTEFYGGGTVGASSRKVRTHPTKLQHANALGHGISPYIGDPANVYAERWCSVIEEYSALDLTYASDRLPAIAGLAKQMARYMLGARYISGIWTERLIIYLAWCRGGSAKKDMCPVSRSSPSWSWAAMPGAVRFPQGSFFVQTPIPQFEAFAKHWPTVESIDIDDDNNDDEKDFMSIRSGSITLYGALMKVYLRLLRTDRDIRTLIVPTDAAYDTTSQLNEVWLDREPNEDELETLWQAAETREYTRSIPLSQVEIPKSGKRMGTPQHFAHVVPVELSQSTPNVLQYYTPLWAFCLGEWYTDSGSDYQYLLLTSIDGSDETFNRMGRGTCSVKMCFFKDVETRNRIILK